VIVTVFRSRLRPDVQQDRVARREPMCEIATGAPHRPV